jgi:cytochrome P450
MHTKKVADHRPPSLTNEDMHLTVDVEATEFNPAARLLERARRDGPIVKLEDGVIGIFDPVLALKVDKENARDLKVAESLIDLLKMRKSAEPVEWREVRSLIAEKSAKLSAPVHMESLYERMRADLQAHAGRSEDLTKIVWQMMSRTLIPMVIDNVDSDGARALIAEQELRFRVQQTQLISFRQRISDFRVLRASSRVITRELKRRVRSGDTHEDYAQSLLTLSDRIGVDRVTYLVTVQLIAISGVPGMMAACLLYAFSKYPDWYARICEETSALDADELYRLPVRKLPCTMRFIKEAMRLWTTPFVTRRIASRDIAFDGVSIKKGETYELSSYIQHHSEEYWEDPETFDPDRWLPSRRQTAPSAYVPFGFGPRSCVGASVGHAQLLLYCALMTRDFRFEFAAGHTPQMRMDDGFAVPADMIGTITPVRKVLS